MIWCVEDDASIRDIEVYALKASGCDEVKLEISGPLSPMKVVPPEGDQFLFLVLPVRLKEE